MIATSPVNPSVLAMILRSTESRLWRSRRAVSEMQLLLSHTLKRTQGSAKLIERSDRLIESLWNNERPRPMQTFPSNN